jgi:exosome complex RNA-binding protein Csl4
MKSSDNSKKPGYVGYGVGDEVSYTFGSGIVYGEVARILEGGAAVEIHFEDGRREMKKSRDGALHLIRRASGQSEIEEQHANRNRVHDTSVSDVIRSEKRRGRW